MALPNPIHHGRGYSQMSGQGSHTPVGGIGWTGLQRGIQNPLLQFSRQDGSGALSLFAVAQSIQSVTLENGPCCDDRGTRHSDLLGNGVVGQALRRKKDDFTLAGQSLWGWYRAGPAFLVAVSGHRARKERLP